MEVVAGECCRGDSESEASGASPAWTLAVAVTQFSRCYFYRFYQVLVNYRVVIAGEMNVGRVQGLGDRSAVQLEQETPGAFSLTGLGLGQAGCGEDSIAE